jgi:response regulator RpfG family c-di-GMP phosphodiesterase
MGAVDYITKPIRPSIVLARVRTQLELKAARDILSDQNAFLESEVARRMHENQLIQQVSIHALARLAETRDPETGKHLHRTQEYVRTLAEGCAATRALPIISTRRPSMPWSSPRRCTTSARSAFPTTSCSSRAS